MNSFDLLKDNATDDTIVVKQKKVAPKKAKKPAKATSTVVLTAEPPKEAAPKKEAKPRPEGRVSNKNLARGKREFDRHSGTGIARGGKKEGEGRRNWGDKRNPKHQVAGAKDAKEDLKVAAIEEKKEETPAEEAKPVEEVEKKEEPVKELSEKEKAEIEEREAMKKLRTLDQYLAKQGSIKTSALKVDVIDKDAAEDKGIGKGYTKVEAPAAQEKVAKKKVAKKAAPKKADKEGVDLAKGMFKEGRRGFAPRDAPKGKKDEFKFVDEEFPTL